MSNNTINTNNSPCFMTSDNTIYILGDFNLTNMGAIIGRLGTYIYNTMPTKPVYTAQGQIESPYSINHSEEQPVIDIFIDSCGGDTIILQDLTALLNIAKLRGAIIRTTVLSCAYSSGSMLAIQGTPGFRIMANHAKHLIHFGSMRFGGSSEAQVKKEEKNARRYKENGQKLYSTYTQLSQKTIQKLCSNEGDFLIAEQCLENGLCDWIIGEQGKLIGRTR